MFVGAVADNFDERIEQKIFHAAIVVDNKAVAAETKAYKPIPDIIRECYDEDGNDTMQIEVERNYQRIVEEAAQIVADELKRIAEDPNLAHLLPNKEE
jgi:hypothetical protein